MGGEWNSATVGDAFQLVNGFAFKSKDFLDSGVPVIKIKNVKAGYFSEHDFSYVDPEFVNSRKDKVANFDDLLISMSGNRHDGSPDTWVGKVALFRKADKYLINQRVGALRVKDKKSFNPRFMSYLLSSWTYQIMFISIATSSGGQANLSPAQILSAPIDYPDIDTQRHIAHILSTLDDKIELNRQMNATLEAMAQALFKSWFVDFDPVIDNALAAGNPIPEPLQARAEMRKALGEQRKPLPAEIQRQFPSRFVFTEEMGWVPEGWEVKPLDSIIELIGGGTPKTSNDAYWDGDIPWFSVVDAPSPSDVFVIHTEKTITQEGLDSSSAKLLPKGTTIISARGTVGKCAVVAHPMAMNQSCYGIRGLHGIPDYYTYYTILLRVSELQQRGHGSVFNTITRDTFKTIKTCVSNHELLSIYDETVTPYMGRIVDNIAQVQSLSRLRDTLLPKLLSGQIRISEAEAMIERAGVAV